MTDAKASPARDTGNEMVIRREAARERFASAENEMKAAAAAYLVADVDVVCPEAAFVFVDGSGRVEFVGGESLIHGAMPTGMACRSAQILSADRPDGILLEVPQLRHLAAVADLVGHEVLFGGLSAAPFNPDFALRQYESVSSLGSDGLHERYAATGTPRGYAVCRCGAKSELEIFNSDRLRWHLEHQKQMIAELDTDGETP